MMDTHAFTYKVTAFDAAKKLLDVAFGDGTWARITLTEPLPTSMGDVDKVVRNYTASVDAATAVANTSADLSFIAGAVGAERAAARLDVKAVLDGGSQPLVQPLAPQSLDDWKRFARASVAARRYAKQIAGVKVGNATMATDPQSAANIAQKVVAISIGGNTEPVQWKMADGSFVTIASADFIKYAQDAHALIQAAYDWEARLDAQIDAATTVAAVQPVLTAS